jgi:hypothetical protein
MTIPFFVEDPTQFHRPKVEVPYDIVQYCDRFTVYADREDLRYIDCVWMHMGYYGTPAHIIHHSQCFMMRSQRHQHLK